MAQCENCFDRFKAAYVVKAGYRLRDVSARCLDGNVVVGIKVDAGGVFPEERVNILLLGLILRKWVSLPGLPCKSKSGCLAASTSQLGESVCTVGAD